MNIHGLIRGLINYIHPDETCVLYQSTGQTNTKGIISSTYTSETITCNVQNVPASLQQIEKVSDTSQRVNVYMYSDETTPVAGITRRPTPRTGDFIYRNKNSQWYLITNVNDWSQEGWCSVEAVLQTTIPNINA